MSADSSNSLALALAQYEHVRGEILSHKTTQQTIVNFIILMAGGELALYAQLGNSLVSAGYINLLLLLPMPIVLLAIYHTAYTIRIHKLASYLNGDLRNYLQTISGCSLPWPPGYQATPTLIAIVRTSRDGQLTSLALMGLKSLPQLVPLIAVLSIGISTLTWWQDVWLVLDAALLVLSVVGQHD